MNRCCFKPDRQSAGFGRDRLAPLNVARRPLEVAADWQIPEADATVLNAVSEAAYVLLSNGVDLLNTLAFGVKTTGHKPRLKKAQPVITRQGFG